MLPALRRRPARGGGLVIVTDPGPDPDDVKSLLIASVLHRQGDLQLRAVICNGGQQQTQRAALARCILDKLGLPAVPVGVGTAGKAYAARPHEFRLLGAALDDVDLSRLEEGAPLFRRVLADAPPKSITVLCISSLRDFADQISADAELVLTKVREVAVQGGLEWSEAERRWVPDTSVNNTFDMEGADRVYSFCFERHVPLAVVSRDAVPMLPMQLAKSFAVRTRDPIMTYLSDAQFLGLEGLWRKLCAGELPARCTKQWYFATFCGTDAEAFEREGHESLDARADIVRHLNGFVKPYDVVALMTVLPHTRNFFPQPAPGFGRALRIYSRAEHAVDTAHVLKLLRDTYHEVVLMVQDCSASEQPLSGAGSPRSGGGGSMTRPAPRSRLARLGGGAGSWHARGGAGTAPGGGGAGGSGGSKASRVHPCLAAGPERGLSEASSGAEHARNSASRPGAIDQRMRVQVAAPQQPPGGSQHQMNQAQQQQLQSLFQQHSQYTSDDEGEPYLSPVRRRLHSASAAVSGGLRLEPSSGGPDRDRPDRSSRARCSLFSSDSIILGSPSMQPTAAAGGGAAGEAAADAEARQRSSVSGRTEEEDGEEGEGSHRLPSPLLGGGGQPRAASPASPARARSRSSVEPSAAGARRFDVGARQRSRSSAEGMGAACAELSAAAEEGALGGGGARALFRRDESASSNGSSSATPIATPLGTRRRLRGPSLSTVFTSTGSFSPPPGGGGRVLTRGARQREVRLRTLVTMLERAVAQASRAEYRLAVGSIFASCCLLACAGVLFALSRWAATLSLDASGAAVPLHDAAASTLYLAFGMAVVSLHPTSAFRRLVRAVACGLVCANGVALGVLLLVLARDDDVDALERALGAPEPRVAAAVGAARIAVVASTLAWLGCALSTRWAHTQRLLLWLVLAVGASAGAEGVLTLTLRGSSGAAFGGAGRAVALSSWLRTSTQGAVSLLLLWGRARSAARAALNACVRRGGGRGAHDGSLAPLAPLLGYGTAHVSLPAALVSSADALFRAATLDGAGLDAMRDEWASPGGGSFFKTHGAEARWREALPSEQQAPAAGRRRMPSRGTSTDLFGPSAAALNSSPPPPPQQPAAAAAAAAHHGRQSHSRTTWHGEGTVPDAVLEVLTRGARGPRRTTGECRNSEDGSPASPASVTRHPATPDEPGGGAVARSRVPQPSTPDGRGRLPPRAARNISPLRWAAAHSALEQGQPAQPGSALRHSSASPRPPPPPEQHRPPSESVSRASVSRDEPQPGGLAQGQRSADASIRGAVSSLTEASFGPLGHRAEYYVVHSPADSAEHKLGALRAWALSQPSPPVAWVDALCADLSLLDHEHLPHMLANMHACRRLLLLAGPQLADSLWCVAQLYAWSALGRSIDDVEVVLVAPQPPEAGAAHGGADGAPSGGGADGGADGCGGAAAAAAAAPTDRRAARKSTSPGGAAERGARQAAESELAEQNILAAFDAFAVHYARAADCPQEDGTRIIHSVELASASAYNEVVRQYVPLIRRAIDDRRAAARQRAEGGAARGAALDGPGSGSSPSPPTPPLFPTAAAEHSNHRTRLGAATTAPMPRRSPVD